MSCNHLVPSAELLSMYPEDANQKNQLYLFTIMREPYSLLKSAFNYYLNSQQHGPCFQRADTLKKFLDDYSRINKRNRGEKDAICHNHMGLDLGYSSLLSDSEQIDSIIQIVDQKYNLVMILEKYYESLIFLKEDLNLEYEDLVSFKLNSAIKRPEKIAINTTNKEENDKYRQLTRKYNRFDTKLYDHFRQKLESKIIAYGESKMQNEVRKLKRLTLRYLQICKVREVVPELENGDFSEQQNIPANKKPWHAEGLKVSTLLMDEEEIAQQAKMYNLDFESLKEDCLMKTLPELSMVKYVKNKQIEKNLLVTKPDF